MASQVPYNPDPQIAPQDRPIPYKELSTPLAAFGGAVADATSHLGAVTSQVGDELFQRAYAMQTLNEQAKASAATAQYQNDEAQHYLDYTSKEGKDAVDGLPGYIQGSEQRRRDVGSTLDSPYAQQQFNQETRNSRFRFIFSAGMHAKDQNKSFVLGSSNARIDSAANSALANPGNDDQFAAGKASVISEANHQADIKGLPQDDPARQELVQNAVTKVTAQRIQGLGKLQPFKAQQVLDDAVKNGDLVGPDVGRLTDFVNRQRYSVGARQGTAQVMSGSDMSLGDKILPAETARIGIKGIEGGSYQAIGTKVTYKNGQIDNALGAYQVMGTNLAPWLKEAGMAPMTQPQFLASHDAQDQLFDFKFGQYMQRYGSFNAAAKAWFTGTTNPAEGVIDPNGTTVPKYLRVANAAIAHQAPLKDLNAAGQRLASTLAPDDPMFGEYMTQNIEIQYNRERAIQKDDEFNNKQTVYHSLINGGPDGKLPTTVDDLKRADPAAGQAYEAMDSTDQLRVMEVLNKNAKGDVAWNVGRQQRYQDLIGEAVHDPDKFLSQDILNEDLPWSAKKEFIDMQAKVYKKADADPQVTRALGILGDKLQASGLTKTQDQAGLNQFTGALRGAMQAYQDINKKPPKDEEIELMGTKLLQRQGANHFWQSGTETFRVPVPDEAASAIKSDPKWAEWNIEPTEQDIERIYARAQFQDFYGKQKIRP